MASAKNILSASAKASSSSRYSVSLRERYRDKRRCRRKDCHARVARARL